MIEKEEEEEEEEETNHRGTEDTEKDEKQEEQEEQERRPSTVGKVKVLIFFFLSVSSVPLWFVFLPSSASFNVHTKAKFSYSFSSLCPLCPCGSFFPRRRQASMFIYSLSAAPGGQECDQVVDVLLLERLVIVVAAGAVGEVGHP